MTTTATLRNWWAPACRGPFETVSLHGEGRVTVRSTIVAAVAALDACLHRHDYRTRRADTGAYNCRKITGGTGYSLHAYGIAVDLNWQTNPYGPRLVTDMPEAMVTDIKAIRTRNGRQVWRWGGDYRGNKDAMHFEVICSPADLATGIDPRSLPATPEPAPQEDDMADYLAQIDAIYQTQWNRGLNPAETIHYVTMLRTKPEGPQFVVNEVARQLKHPPVYTA